MTPPRTSPWPMAMLRALLVGIVVFAPRPTLAALGPATAPEGDAPPLEAEPSPPAEEPSDPLADWVRKQWDALRAPSAAPDERLKGGTRAPPLLVTAPVRRFALVVGANAGGPERSLLRFAESDARTMATVLRDLGGVAASDIVRLSEPTPDELEAAFGLLAGRVATAEGVHAQFVFYYSGHSDEGGLLLGDQRLPYRALRRLIDRMPADVRVAILDSCASGAFTRSKGGTHQAPFLVTRGADVRGHAFLTSSSASEAAQESDRIGGSFFTHYLLTGMRGAADRNRDRLITLGEAYQFASEETLARTEATRGGPQHAAYEFQLSGTDDLVMTDLRRRTGRLELGAGVVGRVTVRDRAGTLAAELYKPVDHGPVLLALEPGTYRVTVDDGSRLRRATVRVSESDPSELGEDALALAAAEPVRTRGDASPELRHVPVDAGLFPALSVNRFVEAERIRNSFSLSVLWGRVAVLEGGALSLGLSIVDEKMSGIQLGLFGNIGRGQVNGLQWSNLFNKAGTLSGAQFSLVNVADRMEPAGQLGLVNRASGSSRGVQIGLVNVATDLRGVQIGLFNAARSADAQLGLLSATQEGGIHPEVWTSDTAQVAVGLRLPARYTYTSLGVAASFLEDHAAWQYGIGFGGHIPLPSKTYLDIDMTSWLVAGGVDSSGPLGGLFKLRTLFGFAPYARLAVFGGPTLNLMVSSASEKGALNRPGYDYHHARHQGEAVSRLWVGFASGLRF